MEKNTEVKSIANSPTESGILKSAIFIKDDQHDFGYLYQQKSPLLKMKKEQSSQNSNTDLSPSKTRNDALSDGVNDLEVELNYLEPIIENTYDISPLPRL